MERVNEAPWSKPFHSEPSKFVLCDSADFDVTDVNLPRSRDFAFEKGKS